MGCNIAEIWAEIELEKKRNSLAEDEIVESIRGNQYKRPNQNIQSKSNQKAPINRVDGNIKLKGMATDRLKGNWTMTQRD